MVAETLFQKAEKIVNGARDKDYGRAQDNFSNIAKAWSGVIQSKLKEDITAKDVALLMTVLKVVREGNKHTEDNVVDAAGYLILADRIENG